MGCDFNLVTLTPTTPSPTSEGQCALLYPEATSVLYNYDRVGEIHIQSGQYCVQPIDLEADHWGWGFSPEYIPGWRWGANIASDPHSPSSLTCRERYGNANGAISTSTTDDCWGGSTFSPQSCSWTHNVENPAFVAYTASEIGCTNFGREVEFIVGFDGDRDDHNLYPVTHA